MTPDTQQKLKRATEIENQIIQLRNELDSILVPLATAAIEADDPNETLELIGAMPGGFERTELRTSHISRMADRSYKVRLNHPLTQHDLRCGG